MLDRPSGSVQYPNIFPLHVVLLIPLMLRDGRSLCVPLIACIPVIFNPHFKHLCVSPTYTLPHWQRIWWTTPASFFLGRGSFTLVSSKQRVGPDLKTIFKVNFSQNFLICSLNHVHMGLLLAAASPPVGNPFLHPAPLLVVW